MKRNEFIQMTVVELIKTQKFMKSALELNQSEVENYCIMAKQIADDVAEVAPFDDDFPEIDFERIKCFRPEKQLFNHEELEVEQVGDIEGIDKICVRNAMQRAKGSRDLASKILGISTRKLNAKIKQYNL